MSEISEVSPQTIPERSSLESAQLACEVREKACESTTRFHLVLDLSTAALVCTILKMDGPYYADAIVAGLFICGFGLTVYSYRCVRRVEIALSVAESQRRAEEERLGLTPTSVSHRPGPAIIFVLLATFFVSAAVATLWFSYASIRDQGASGDDSVAVLRTGRPGAC